MLTDEQILENKNHYISLLHAINADSPELLSYLDYVNFFYKPATVKQFNAFAGGLCKYALDLCREIDILSHAYLPEKYTKEDIIKVALFRDLYRAELFEATYKNVKNKETDKWESVLSYQVKEGSMRPTFGEIGFSSYMIAKKFVNFTDEQIEAIYCSRERLTPDLPEISKSFPLVCITMMADLAVSYIRGENEN